ncbi:MAG TPA: DUF2332 family protein [Allosphingosinicella sp.]|nr:DUF2332 family protein [Allosphingosinicella sp.]
MATEAEIRASFAEQARFCAALGAPFTALLCDTLGGQLDRRTETGRRVLDWRGDPGPFGDALALRLCGGLHFLVFSDRNSALGRLYPPAPLPAPNRLQDALAPVLAGGTLLPWLDSPPQTNEVGRSAVLMSGLLAIAAQFPLPMRLFELGASAGLNLMLDRYRYELGGRHVGKKMTHGPLFRPDWEGPPPPKADVRIVERAGVDLNPARLPGDALKLSAYIWPDQPARGRQLSAALAAADHCPPEIDRGDAADWLEKTLSLDSEAGVTRVVMHSVAFQYFEPDSRRRVAERIAAAGERAAATAPLAWLRFEKEPGEERHSLRLRTWPGGEHLLAWAHPHGRSVHWLSGA